ncbi:hypothetical protein DTO282F9_3607 [Paecilomyces variotii]|nr:hypothetical protein DTO282F9_3607 [Paecilomyces variotii]
MFALLVHWKSHCCMAGVGGEEALLVDISRACFGLILLRPQRFVTSRGATILTARSPTLSRRPSEGSKILIPGWNCFVGIWAAFPGHWNNIFGLSPVYLRCVVHVLRPGGAAARGFIDGIQLLLPQHRNIGSGTDLQPPSAAAELASAQPQDTAAAQQQRATYGRPARKQARCRFFGTKRGCRAGDACPYLHEGSGSARKDRPLEGSTAPGGQEEVNQASQLAASSEKGTAIENRTKADSSAVTLPERSGIPRSKAVQKPVSKAERENPREFQINQLRRRFRPKEQNDSSGTSLVFGMAPSDPDFPFDMAELQCILCVPLSYPSSGRPTLKVTNPEMDRGFQINVEKGFDDLVETSLTKDHQGTLLGWMNALDRQLERLLTTERAQTIKIIPNVGNREKPKSAEVTGNIPQRSPRPVERTSRVEERPTAWQSAIKMSRTYTAEEKAEAEKKRNDETRQLEARLRRLPLFRKSSDGLSFTIPAQPSKPNLLPLPLRSIKTIQLIVPQLYPLDQSRIEVQGTEGTDARSLETGFQKWAQENPHLNLMSQVNYLVHNMHVLFNKAAEETSKFTSESVPMASNPIPPSLPEPSPTEQAPVKELEGRSHVKIIPRPPEWSLPDAGSSSGSETSTDYDSEDASATDDEEEGGASVPEAPATSTSRGVALSLPFLELYGIEILELKNLNITVKCERCKDTMDVKNVRAANDPSGASSARAESCKKCSNYMTVGFRRELMHGSSNRAGYLDLEGCTVVDLLPSNFLPTCSECSTTFPGPGPVAVRGESAMATCRECHRKMVFKIPEVKFLVVGTAAVTTRHALPRKKRKEVLGITAGQELPRRGRCDHYAKSYRWFRFSCCAKVFPCDKCHDAAEDHPNEHANRMICGFCSREQIYRPEDCGICHSVLVGKAGSGFWEGGKGTRDRVRMSRKDPRKYKRRGGTANSTKKK